MNLYLALILTLDIMIPLVANIMKPVAINKWLVAISLWMRSSYCKNKKGPSTECSLQYLQISVNVPLRNYQTLKTAEFVLHLHGTFYWYFQEDSGPCFLSLSWWKLLVAISLRWAFQILISAYLTWHIGLAARFKDSAESYPSRPAPKRVRVMSHPEAVRKLHIGVQISIGF